MKKLLSLVLSLVIAMGLSVNVLAATETLGSADIVPTLDGKFKTVNKLVRGERENYRVVGLYYPEESRKMLTLVNQARREEGLAALKWEPKLEEAAIQRALEQHVVRGHVRPDGSNWSTVDSYANGENLLRGLNIFLDPEAALEEWLNSPDHYSNIMAEGATSKYFVSMAAACVETDRGIIWVQLFHAEKDTGGSGSAGASKTSSSAVDSTSGTSAVVTAKSIVTDLGKVKASGSNVPLTLKATDKLGLDVIKAAADWGTKNKKNVLLTVPTLTSTGKSNQGMFTMNPVNFTKNKNAVKTGVYVEQSAVKSVNDSIAKKYPNAKFAVIGLEQSGSYGGRVSIGAKADLSKLDTKSLLLYTYDAKTGKLEKLDLGKEGYSIDKNNYLRFSTTKGGYIVVTDKEF